MKMISEFVKEGKIRSVTSWSITDELCCDFCDGKEASVTGMSYDSENGFTFIGKDMDRVIEMTEQEIQQIIEKQRKFFESGKTLPVAFRKENLKKLYDFIYKDCDDLYLKRKKEKFEEIFCALNEKSLSETGLIAGTPEMVISSQATNVEGSSTIPEMEVESSDSKCPALNK